jgi:pimeloyl-ACP methyl ester carboxylesterase
VKRQTTRQVRKHQPEQWNHQKITTLLFKSFEERVLSPALLQRAVANGLDEGELQECINQARSAQDLPCRLAHTAENFRSQAQFWIDLQEKSKAGRDYLNAALWNFYSYFMEITSPSKRAKYYAQCESDYLKAGTLFEHKVETVRVPYMTDILNGYLRIPSPTSQQPCIVLLNTFGSAKEELYFVENAFLQADLATLSVDLPKNIGESDHKRLADTLHQCLINRKEIDTSKIALFGFGTGGSLAFKFALQNKEYKAVATISAPYDLGSDLTHLFPLLNNELGPINQEDIELLYKFSNCISLRDELVELSCPVLIVGGGRDRIVPINDTKVLFEQTASENKQLILYPDAGHGCFEAALTLRPEIAHWFKYQFSLLTAK